MDSMAQYREHLLASVGGDFERFRGWFTQRTFIPDRLAKSALDAGASEVASIAERLTQSGATAEQISQWVTGYVKRWAAYQSAGSRTLNWMITGPARFPVDRNKKRMDVEHRRLDELMTYAKGADEWLRHQENRAARAELSAQAASVEHEETEVCGIRMVRNTTLDRVQLIFPGKPHPETITILKKFAFRWSPREGTWQRQLTANGMRAARNVLASLVEEA